MESVWHSINFNIILSSWPLNPNYIFLLHFAIKTVYALLISVFNNFKHFTEDASKYSKNEIYKIFHRFNLTRVNLFKNVELVCPSQMCKNFTQ
jgi:hypothetical protein